MILGRTSAQTLFIGVDQRGLWYRIPPGTSRVHEDVRAAVSRGDINGSSFGFTVDEEGDQRSRDESGKMVRTITKVSSLFDVGPVTFPAYEATAAEAHCLGFRSAEGLRYDIMLREVLAQSKRVQHTHGS